MCLKTTGGTRHFKNWCQYSLKQLDKMGNEFCTMYEGLKFGADLTPSGGDVEHTIEVNSKTDAKNNDITIDYVKKECQSMFKNPKCKTVVFEFVPMETSAPKSTAKCYCVNKDPSQVQVLDMRKPLYQLDNSR